MSWVIGDLVAPVVNTFCEHKHMELKHIQKMYGSH